MKNMNSKLKKVAIIVLVLILVLIGSFYIYTLDYYRADDYVIEAYSSNVNVKSEDNMTIFYPDKDADKGIGLIFYPGGKVEAIAYAPLLQNISNNGITCVLVEMPLNLAVFDINAADKVYSAIPDIDQWYLAGHSLGGAMASSYVDKNADKLDGLILLGAYPIDDADIPTLAIYGSEDEGLDITKLEHTENKFEIAGGNHAYFGDYGEQKGDGTASIAREEQQEKTVEMIINFIKTY